MTPEGRVKQAIKRWLVARGAWFYMPVSNGMGVHGIPDFVCCLPGGRFLGIEAKAPGKRSSTTPLQRHQIESIRAANGLALVVDDVRQLDELELVCP